VEVLRQIDAWPARHAAVAVISRDGRVVTYGESGREFWWASLTKLLTAVAALVAVEEGAVDLNEAAGPPGSTVRHLLAHASGLPMDGHSPVAQPGTRRIYSNTGFEVLAALVAEQTGISFSAYLAEAVLGPLALRCELRGSPASGIHGALGDLVAVARELLAPTLLAAETLAEATSVTFPQLPGVLPGFGRMERNDWGLGFELRDAKSPHWTGRRNSPRTFGHFGGSGTFLWVDPDAGLGCACLTDLEFGDWAKAAWPRLSDDVLAEQARP
jgi:CubicO group peptidase (beta-lactamase class C family)